MGTEFDRILLPGRFSRPIMAKEAVDVTVLLSDKATEYHTDRSSDVDTCPHGTACMDWES